MVIDNKPRLEVEEKKIKKKPLNLAPGRLLHYQ